MILTQKMVERYKINYPDFTGLQFYISDPLVLEASDTRWSKDVDDGHWLNTHELQTSNLLTIKENLPGKCVEFIPENNKPKILPKRIRDYFNDNRMKLRVNFDNDYLNFLIFSPDKDGNFALVFDKKDSTVQYGGIKYKCRDGCEDRMLLIDVSHDSTGIFNERALPGNEFRD